MKKHPFLISDNSITTKNIIVLSDGIDFTDFRGVMFYFHKEESLPIGNWEDIQLKDGKVYGNAIFDQDDEFAVKIEKKVEKGLIQCCSISVAPDLTKVYLNDDGVVVVPKSRAREISITPIGSNLNAVRLCDESTGEDLSIINLSASLKELANLPKNQKILMEKKTITGILNLSDDVEDAVVIARIKAGEEAIIKLSDDKKTRFNKLLTESKLPQALKDQFVSLTDDPDKLESLIAAVPATVNLRDVTEQGQQKLTKEEENWTFADYSKKAPEKLAALQKSDPARYKELFKAQYGVEPSTK